MTDQEKRSIYEAVNGLWGLVKQKDDVTAAMSLDFARYLYFAVSTEPHDGNFWNTLCETAGVLSRKYEGISDKAFQVASMILLVSDGVISKRFDVGAKDLKYYSKEGEHDD